MKTKTLMSKVTLGAAMILTTAAVATTVVVPNIVRADDTAIADKDAKVFTVYGFNGTVSKASYNDIYGYGPDLAGLAKIRDFEYTLIDPETGYWAVGPNGERNYDPNAVKPAPAPQTTTETTESTTQTTTTPSTTEPATTDDTVVADKNAEIYTIYDISGYGKVSWHDIFDENGVLYPDLAKLRDYEYTTVSKDGIWSVGPNGERNYDPNAVKPEPTTPSTTDNTQTSGSSATTESSEASSTEGTGVTGTTSSTTEASQTSVADKGQASTTGAKQDNATTSSQETKTETSNSSAPVATTTAVNGSKTASSATPAKTNQLPVTGESNLISTIMGITGLTLLLSLVGFKAYRESK